MRTSAGPYKIQWLYTLEYRYELLAWMFTLKMLKLKSYPTAACMDCIWTFAFNSTGSKFLYGLPTYVHAPDTHATMVQRMIGSRVGTGGSSGYDYLKATTGWELEHTHACEVYSTWAIMWRIPLEVWAICCSSLMQRQLQGVPGSLQS